MTPLNPTPSTAPTPAGAPGRGRRAMRITATAGLCAALAASATLIPTSGSAAPEPVAAGPVAAPPAITPADLLLRTGAANAASRSADRGPAPVKATAAAKAEKPSLPAAKASGTRYARMAVNVRSAPSADSRSVDVLAAGAKVTITQNRVDGWQQVLHEGRARWVKASLLAREKPAASRSAAAAGGGISSAPCPTGSGMERGLTSNAIKVHRAVCHRFPQVTNYGGNRADSGSNHSSGHAVDIMVTGALGDQIAAWLRANAGRLGVTELIWEQRIWTTQRAGDGWRSMSDRGSATANHYDHVHVSVR